MCGNTRRTRAEPTASLTGRPWDSHGRKLLHVLDSMSGYLGLEMLSNPRWYVRLEIRRPPLQYGTRALKTDFHYIPRRIVREFFPRDSELKNRRHVNKKGQWLAPNGHLQVKDFQPLTFRQPSCGP